jgi:hypothetical protein
MKKSFLLMISVCSLIAAKAQFTLKNGLSLGLAPNQTSYVFVDYGDPNRTNSLVQIEKQAFSINSFFMPQYHLVKKDNKSGNRGTRTGSSKYSSSRSSSRSSASRNAASDAKPFDLGLAAPINLGASFFNQLTFFYSTGLTANINFNSMSYNNRSKMWGAFVGAGISVANTNLITGEVRDVTGVIDPTTVKYATVANDFNNYKIRGLGIGPLIHAGVEVVNPLSRFQGSKVGLRFGYQPAINRNGLDYYYFTFLQGIPGLN